MMGFAFPTARDETPDSVRQERSFRGRAKQQQWLKLMLGVGLVVASILGTTMLITSLNHTVKLYAAPELMLPGSVVRLSDLHVVEVRLDQLQGHYLAVGAGSAASGEAGIASTVAETQYVLERTIGAGELIPLSALGTRSSQTTALVLPLATELSAQLQIGQQVDIWSVGDPRDEFALPPRILVSAAVLAALPEPDGLLGSQSRMRVEVLLPQATVAKVLAAINAGESLSVVQANH